MRDKIKKFCEEYIIDNNGTQAAIRAGYASGPSAEVQACRHLQRPDVKEYITHLKAEQSKRTSITADKVLEQYRRLAFADIQDYFHVIYELRGMHYITRDSKEYRHDLRIKSHLKRTYTRIINEDTYKTLPTKHKAYYSADEVLKPFDSLDVEQRAAIAGITYDKNGKPILKLSNKETSLDALSKHLGIFEKDNEQKGINLRIGSIKRTIVDPSHD